MTDVEFLRWLADILPERDILCKDIDEYPRFNVAQRLRKIASGKDYQDHLDAHREQKRAVSLDVEIVVMGRIAYGIIKSDGRVLWKTTLD